MRRLAKEDILQKPITNILFVDQLLSNNSVVRNIIFVINENFLIQLLPYGLRQISFSPANAKTDESNDAKKCLQSRIIDVITDTCFYLPAADDSDLLNPPYDDVYIVLDNGLWVANRFLEHGENALTVEVIDELYALSDHYYDYWTREPA